MLIFWFIQSTQTCLISVCSSKFEAKKWLDGEMEKILQKKQAVEELEKVYRQESAGRT